MKILSVFLILFYGSKSLLDCVKIPEYMKPYVPDYKINVFEVAWLDEGTVAKFQSDFRYVAELMVAARKAKEGVSIEKPSGPIDIKHAQETLALLEAMTGDDRFREAYGSMSEGGKPGMFYLFDLYEEKGREEGHKEGHANGVQDLASAIHRLKDGESAEHLVASGVSKEVVEAAISCL